MLHVSRRVRRTGAGRLVGAIVQKWAGFSKALGLQHGLQKDRFVLHCVALCCAGDAGHATRA